MGAESTNLIISILGEEFKIGQSYVEAYSSLKKIYTEGISEFNEGDTLVCIGNTALTFNREDKVTSISVDYSDIKYTRVELKGVKLKGTPMEIMHGISFVCDSGLEVINTKRTGGIEKVYILENIDREYELVIIKYKVGNTICKIQATGTFKSTHKVDNL